MSGDVVTTLLAALFGLAVGSFLNVCIHRLPLGMSIAHPPSRCPSCGRPIRWYENVPVVSWLALRGRCAGCGQGISIAYPLVEIVTGVVFAAAWLLYGPSVLLVSRLLFACAMIVLFMIDLEHQILPNLITLPGIAAGLLFSLVTPPGPRDAAIGAVAGAGVLLAIAEGYYRIRGEEGLGMGDVKMLGMIGAFLGWQQMLLTLFLASMAGSVVGLSIIAVRRGDMRYALPFGTFLAVGALLASVVGPQVLDWYVSLYR